jgi:uncharacterized protein YdeI (YjbR/CyaY-like superfamily)
MLECRAVKSASETPIFFRTPREFRAWLTKYGPRTRELWVGFYKKSSAQPSITWPEAVDEALCVGWIDGLRKTIDGKSYKIRFTPRQAKSNWSALNARRVQELARDGRMRPAGMKVFELRLPEKSGIYAYENRDAAALNPAAEQQFRSNSVAWEFFETQPPSYRKTAIWWVVSARKEETQQKRLRTLIADSQARRRIGQLRRDTP